MTADQTTTKMRRPESLANAQHVWIPDPDDPPLVAPYCDPFCALLTGYALGALTVAAIGLIAWAVLR